jgi:TRAP-type C4-dicarboxylate transport system permease small subunit
MRKVLDSVYIVSGYLAGLFLFLTFAIILVQVLLNVMQVLLHEAAGVQFNVMIPSYSEFATYSFAAASFLGLGYTHRHNGHIRVVVLSLKLPARVRAWLELWCLGFATFTACYFAYHAVDQVMLSYDFQDVSSGLIAVPLWLPQLGMAAGQGQRHVAAIRASHDAGAVQV